MKILFIGTVEFSRRMLEKLLSLNANLVGVVSMEDNTINSDFIDFRKVCSEKKLSHLQTNDINSSASVNWIKEKSPDIIFCFGWSRLIKKELLNLPPKGIIGYHPAELPINKGRHPLIWALVLGLEKTGSTFFYMDESADSGDIISQEIVKIDYRDNAASLYEKITLIASSQLEQVYSGLINNTLKSFKQDNSKSNFWRKRSKADGRIDFRMSSTSIYNLVRALSRPYPGAYFEYAGQEVKVWAAREILRDNIENIEPGMILEIKGNSVFVKASDNIIELADHNFQSLPGIGEYL